jgi:hypothetical protein
MHLQAKEHQGLPAVTKSYERNTEQILPQSPEEEPTLPDLNFGLLVS